MHTDALRMAATSDLCTNASLARIADVIWTADGVRAGSGDRRKGVVLTPKQQLQLDAWIEFPVAPSLVPFNVQVGAFDCRRLGAADEAGVLHVLLETQVEPVSVKENNVLGVSLFGVWLHDGTVVINIVRCADRRLWSTAGLEAGQLLCGSARD